MSVLRRFFAMRDAHAGWPGPGLPRLASPATWWTATVAPCSHSSHRRRAEPVDQLLARDGDRDRGRVADDRAPVACEGYPAESCYQVRLALAPFPSLKAGPQSVPGQDLGFVACRGLGDGGVVLGGQGFQQGRLGVPAQRAEPPDVLGEPVVVHDAPVFGSVDPHDVVVGQVLELWPVPGFAPAPVRDAFGPDHVQGYPQRDPSVGRPAAVGEFRVAVLDGDLIAEEPRRTGAGVGDQGLGLVQLQREGLPQERRQFGLDLLGFGLRPDESQDMVIGLCRAPDYAALAGPPWPAGVAGPVCAA